MYKFDLETVNNKTSSQPQKQKKSDKKFYLEPLIQRRERTRNEMKVKFIFWLLTFNIKCSKFQFPAWSIIICNFTTDFSSITPRFVLFKLISTCLECQWSGVGYVKWIVNNSQTVRREYRGSGWRSGVLSAERPPSDWVLVVGRWRVSVELRLISLHCWKYDTQWHTCSSESKSYCCLSQWPMTFFSLHFSLPASGIIS